MTNQLKFETCCVAYDTQCSVKIVFKHETFSIFTCPDNMAKEDLSKETRSKKD